MTAADPDPGFREAFTSRVLAKERVLSLREMLAAQLANGVSRERLIEELMVIYRTFRAAGNEEAEDLVADALDLLTGWCAPQYKL